MTKNTNNIRILAIAPATKGWGYAVIEGRESLVDWGTKTVIGKKSKTSLQKVAELIQDYQPTVLIMEDYEAKSSLRSASTRKLGRSVIALAKELNLKVETISREQVQRAYFADGKGTKQERAVVIAELFPKELRSILPPPRKAWKSEDHHMGVFDAVALAVASQMRSELGSRRNAEVG